MGRAMADKPNSGHFRERENIFNERENMYVVDANTLTMFVAR
jgi:hypothetical protein